MSGASQSGFDFAPKARADFPWGAAEARREAQPLAKRKLNQCDRILALLREANGLWVPLPCIMDLRPRIAMYVTRIYELRLRGAQEGFQIDNKMEHDEEGNTRSWYRLRLTGLGER